VFPAINFKVNLWLDMTERIWVGEY